MSVVVWAVACNGESNCDAGYPIDVTVTDPESAPLDGATVTLIDSATLEEVACTGEGAGKYRCIAPAPGDYNVYAEMTSFEGRGLAVTVDDAIEDCSEPVMTLAFLLARESGV
ncbi:MAG: carboxypeptidase-like regulatory domain-containing protein [Myxococcota bacterium]